MYRHKNFAAPPTVTGSWTARLLNGGFAALSLMILLCASSAQAAQPAANTPISNQATADYTDSAGSPQRATSNQVTTTVAQVGSFTLVTNNTKSVAPGTTVYMPHTLTNTGNGSDTFDLTLANLASVSPNYIDSIQIFADANQDGAPDNPSAPLCKVTTTTNTCTGSTANTGPLSAGDTYNFVVAVAVSATAPDAVTQARVVTATPEGSYGYSPATQTNTDTINIVNNQAVFDVGKSITTQTSGPMGTSPVTYKLKYTNSGNAAGSIYIKDVIGSGATIGFSYVTGSGVWSSSATALSDASTDPAGIDYKVTTASGVSTIEAVIANVPANASGYITFNLAVKSSGVALGTSETTNKAQFANTSCTSLASCTVPTTLVDTNLVPFTVIGSYNVIANDNGSASTNTDDGTVAGDNLVTVSTAAPGAVVTFDDYIWNTGDSTDSFNVAVDIANLGGTFTVGSTTYNSFPAGTTFKLFQADGVTPLLSSNADGVPDTGPVAANTSYKVVVQATIPANACTLIDCTAVTDFTAPVTATSTADNTKTNTVYDQLGSITPPGVDLMNGDGFSATAGSGVKDEAGANTAGAIVTNSINPGETAYFALNVKNTGTANDSYNLAYHMLIPSSGGTSSQAAVTTTSFSPNTLPSGWTIAFHTNTGGTSCSASTLGSVLAGQNTGIIAPSATKNYCAVVTAPATGTNALAGDYNLYFQATSGSSGSMDIKLDRVSLNKTNILTLTPNGIGQVQPGGTILYPHTLLAGGNNTCGGDFTFKVTNNNSAAGWTYVLYYDVNGNGTVEGGTDIVIGGGANATDTLTSSLPALNAGQQHKLIVKVQAPSGAASQDLDLISIIADDTTGTCNDTSAITDNTTVLAGQIRLTKTQVIDASCGATAPTSGYVDTALTAKPGECIWYRIIAENYGDAEVSAVVINDSTPTYTTYKAGAACANVTNMGSITAPTATSPADGASGSVSCDNWATIPAAGKVKLDFSVKIDQ